MHLCTVAVANAGDLAGVFDSAAGCARLAVSVSAPCALLRTRPVASPSSWTLGIHPPRHAGRHSLWAALRLREASDPASSRTVCVVGPTHRTAPACRFANRPSSACLRGASEEPPLPYGAGFVPSVEFARQICRVESTHGATSCRSDHTLKCSRGTPSEYVAHGRIAHTLRCAQTGALWANLGMPRRSRSLGTAERTGSWLALFGAASRKTGLPRFAQPGFHKAHLYHRVL
jgi:hypothetical protein